jgi:hypothetical protein
MPFDLIRHDLLMTLRPLSPERIKSIVDDLFLPLVAANMAAPANVMAANQVIRS